MDRGGRTPRVRPTGGSDDGTAAAEAVEGFR